MSKSGIYKITNKVSNKIYVGSAADIDRRWKRHIYELINHKHPNKHLQHSWLKYGRSSFKFDIVEIVFDKSKLFEREQHWLDELEPYYYNKGYNLSNIAQGGGFKLLQRSIDKISKAAKGNKNRRNVSRWPCVEGIYCKCGDCLTVKKFEQHFRNKLRNAA